MSQIAPTAESIRVCVRVRPSRENEGSSLSCSSKVLSMAGGGQSFAFSGVYGGCNNQSFHADECMRLVDQLLEGFNGCMLCYGQTGSGKTYTVMGEEGDKGCIERAVEAVFAVLESRRSAPGGQKASEADSKNAKNAETGTETGTETESGVEEEGCTTETKVEETFDYDAKVQFLEVYGEEVRDLLGDSPSKSLALRDIFSESGSSSNVVNTGEVAVVGSRFIPVSSSRDVTSLVQKGMSRRITGETAMNNHSSRSHAVFCLTLKQSLCKVTTTTATVDNVTSDPTTTKVTTVANSKLYFVDLAGSERQKKTQATGRRLAEGERYFICFIYFMYLLLFF